MKGKTEMSARAVKAAIGKGADAAQAMARVSRTGDVAFENGRLKDIGSSQRTSMTVKVVKNGRLGTSETSNPEDLDSVVDRALEVVEFGGPVHFSIPVASPLPAVKTFDPSLASLSPPEMVEMGNAVVERIKGYNPDITVNVSLRRSATHVELSNSAGASYTEEHTDFGVWASGQLVRGTDILLTGDSMGRKDRPADADELANRIIDRFRRSERSAPIASGTVPVIFSPIGLSALLLSLTLGLDGKNVELGSSPLCGRIGERIADARFSLSDDPLMDFGLQSGSFDNEGVPRRTLPLVRDGVLESFIFDLDTAGRAGTRPTGHGSERQLTNLVVKEGGMTLADMMATDRALLAFDFLGLGQGNPMNGDFSLNLALGFLVEGGEIVGRVKDVMLSGNAYDALLGISAVSAEREWCGPYAPFPGLFPYVLVKELSVTAK
jgi:PmbA protein